MHRSLVAFCFAATALAQDRDAAFATRLAAIVPAGTELAWHAVAWRPELRAALLEAGRDDKPVLLWAMNGHPLGQC
jgi:hypothetical protein